MASGAGGLWPCKLQAARKAWNSQVPNHLMKKGVYIHIHMFSYMYIAVYKYSCMGMFTCLCTYTYICRIVCVCMYICIHSEIHTYIYIYACIQWDGKLF